MKQTYNTGPIISIHITTDEYISMHSLRHSFTTHRLESGVDLRFIKEMPVHQSPKTTMIYTQVREKQLKTIRSPIEDILEQDKI